MTGTNGTFSPLNPFGPWRVSAVESLDVMASPTRVAMRFPAPAAHHLAAYPPGGQLAKQGVRAFEAGNLVERLHHAAACPIRCAPAGNHVLYRQEVRVPARLVIEEQATVVRPPGVNVSAQDKNLRQRNQLGKRPQPNPPKTAAASLDDAKRAATYGVGSFA